MCGRYVSATSPEDVAAYFDVDRIAESLVDSAGAPTAIAEPNYNVAPTDPVPVVRERSGERLLEPFAWGLVPFWAKEAKVGAKMINARAETVATNGAFKHAFAKRRCIIPADGFYEWTKVEGAPGAKPRKQPWYIETTDGSIMGFAGLYEYWRGPGGEGAGEAPDEQEPLLSCTIITTTANERIGELHDRMPVVLQPLNWDLWLDPDYRDGEHLQDMLLPAPSEHFMFHKVGMEVNNSRSRGPHLRDALVDSADSASQIQGVQGTLL